MLLLSQLYEKLSMRKLLLDSAVPLSSTELQIVFQLSVLVLRPTIVLFLFTPNEQCCFLNQAAIFSENVQMNSVYKSFPSPNSRQWSKQIVEHSGAFSS